MPAGGDLKPKIQLIYDEHFLLTSAVSGFLSATRYTHSCAGYKQQHRNRCTMTEQAKPTRPTHVIGPDGQPLTLADLPSPSTRRWVIRRKAKVVAAVRGGLISLEEACERYHLSVEEFLSWQRMIERHGLPGLRVTRIQHYRSSDVHSPTNRPDYRMTDLEQLTELNRQPGSQTSKG
jgi:Protein of unknown function (DUF1153)